MSGPIRFRSDLKPDDWRLENPRFSEEAIAHKVLLADSHGEIAAEIGATAAQVALAWLAAIPGTRRIGRLDENLAAQDITLEQEHLDRLETLSNQGVVGERYGIRSMIRSVTAAETGFRIELY